MAHVVSVSVRRGPVRVTSAVAFLLSCCYAQLMDMGVARAGAIKLRKGGASGKEQVPYSEYDEEAGAGSAAGPSAGALADAGHPDGVAPVEIRHAHAPCWADAVNRSFDCVGDAAKCLGKTACLPFKGLARVVQTT